MNVQRTLIASAILSLVAPLTHAQGDDEPITKVVVTASPFKNTEGDQILTPAKILSGDELRDKVGSSLGETLSQELGVSASAFGAGASRPIIRGLEGARAYVGHSRIKTTEIYEERDWAVAVAIAREIG